MVDVRSRAALSGHDLDLSYGSRRVVNSASLSLAAGKVTSLVGPNGSGKSTLLRSLARLHRVDSGTVALAGHPDAMLLSRREFAQRVTLLAQHRPNPSGISVRDLVGYGRQPYLRRWGRSSAQDLQAIDEAMAKTRVTTMADRPIDELSGGELQRVWLASCLAQDASVLLLDEPTTFLDLRHQVEFLDLICELAELHNVAVGVVLHDLNHAAEVSDTVAVMHRGTVRVAGRPEAVLTAELLSEVYGIQIQVRLDDETGVVHIRPMARRMRSALVLR